MEELFTVSGRSDANPNCQLKQPPFGAAAAVNDIIFRIPTPTFGDGLVENIDDSTLLNYLKAKTANEFMIGGAVNHNPNDGTISRFGWKAQNVSMHIFAGEAYNAEMGITNLLFPQDRPLPEEDMPPNVGLPSACINLSGGGYPENAATANGSSAVTVLDDVSEFANFMRLLAPPPTGPVFFPNGLQASQQSIETFKSSREKRQLQPLGAGFGRKLNNCAGQDLPSRRGLIWLKPWESPKGLFLAYPENGFRVLDTLRCYCDHRRKAGVPKNPERRWSIH